MRVFGYVRVSSSGQAKDGYSLAAQRQLIADFCQREGHTLVDLLADEGISGVEAKIADRHGLLSILSRLPEIQAIVVVNTSRLWRDDIAKALIKREFLHHNVEVFSIEQSGYKLNSSDPSEFLVNGMLELLDQYVKMQLVLTMEKGRLEKLSKGGFPGGGVPLGYSTKDGELEVKEAEQDIVILVATLRKQGYGYHKIASILNSRGIRGKRSGRFYPTTIKKVLQNSTYTGELKYGQSKVRGRHTPLMSKTSFARNQFPRKAK